MKFYERERSVIIIHKDMFCMTDASRVSDTGNCSLVITIDARGEDRPIAET